MGTTHLSDAGVGLFLRKVRGISVGLRWSVVDADFEIAESRHWVAELGRLSGFAVFKLTHFGDQVDFRQ